MYESMKYADLRTELKKRGLHANGKKEELIQRLVNSDVKDVKMDDGVDKEVKVDGKKSGSKKVKRVEQVDEVADDIRKASVSEKHEEITFGQANNAAYLDHATLVLILSFAKEHITSASQVSRDWYRASKDKIFSFCTVECFSMDEYLVPSGMPLYYYQSEPSTSLQDKYTIEKGKPDLATTGDHLSRDEAARIIEFLITEGFTNELKLWKIRTYVGPPQDEHSPSSFYCHYQINTTVLQRLIEARTVFSDDSFLSHIYARLRLYQLHRIFANTYPTAQRRNVLARSIAQPEGLSPKLNLYNYQLQAIEWMQSIENSHSKGLEYCTVEPTRLISRSGTIYFTETEMKTGLDASDFSMCFPKGGVLADEMGLGKTLEVIGLILASPKQPMKPATPKFPNISGLPELATLEEVEEYRAKFLGFLNKPKKTKYYSGKKRRKGQTVEEINDVELADVDISASLFQTHATLVICPPHLVGQWKDEICSRTSPKLKVVSFFAAADFGEISYRNIMEADVVVVSDNLLCSPNYFHLGHITPAAGIRKADYANRINWVKRYLLELLREKEEALDNVGTIFDHFSWHRIVLDECHELNSTSFAISNLTAAHWWCVSGTPFPYEDVLTQTMSILGFAKNAIHEFMSHFVWRNTKRSVQAEYKTPDAIFETKLIELSDIEKCVYLEHPDTLLRTTVNLARVQLVGRIKDRLWNSYLNGIYNLLNLPIYSRTSIKELVVAYARAYNADLIMANGLSVALVMEHVSDAALAKVIAEKGDLDALNVESSDIEEIDNDEVEDEELSQSKKGKEPVSGITDEQAKAGLINNCGTKIGELLFYLMKLWERDPSARALVFSSNPAFLAKLEKHLNSGGIATGRMSGSAVVRTRVISRFKSSEGKLRVLLVNYNIASSGTNLVEASHIFLMDVSTEANTAQAVARAHRQGQRKNITVVRFILQDTTDHCEAVAAEIVDTPVRKENLNIAYIPLPRKEDLAKLLIRSQLIQYNEIAPLIAAS